MKEPVFMDKLGFCQQLSMKSAVFMDNQTDDVFRRPPPPSEAPPSRGWHVASNTPSVRFLNRSAKNYFAAEIKRFSTSDLFIAPSMHMNCISLESPAINTKLSIMFSSPAV